MTTPTLRCEANAATHRCAREEGHDGPHTSPSGLTWTEQAYAALKAGAPLPLPRRRSSVDLFLQLTRATK